MRVKWHCVVATCEGEIALWVTIFEGEMARWVAICDG